MLVLSSTSDAIKIITSAATNVDVHADWADDASGTITPGRTNTAISTAATTTVVGSPGLSTQRGVFRLSARNKDATTANTLTFEHTDGSTTVEIAKITLNAGESAHYLDGFGFIVYGANGAVKTTQPGNGVLNFTTAKTITSLGTTRKALGLAVSATAQRSGTFLVFMGAQYGNANSGQTTSAQLAWGTGSAPANNATTGLGTLIGTQQQIVTSAASTYFTWVAVITGVALGTTIWVDMECVNGSSTTVTASFSDAAIFVVEL